MLRTVVAVALLLSACPAAEPTGRLTVRLFDPAGKPAPGLFRVVPAGGSRGIELQGPLNRGHGLPVRAGRLPTTPAEKKAAQDQVASIREWYVCSGSSQFAAPVGKYRVEAIAGLETELASAPIELASAGATVDLALRPFVDLHSRGVYAGNTHLHLARIPRIESDQYLTEIPPAERLDVLFVSYLLRPSEDRFYISNEYPVGDLRSFWSRGVLVNNGQEMRNNFSPFAQGFGHVMMLDMKRRVEPVSIGRGITGAGDDFPPLAAGIDEARAQGARIIWCHNTFGTEDVPNFVMSRVDALNCFDGGMHGTFADTYYTYLNAGIRVPFSTGTDWFLYDFNRVHVKVDGALTIKSWLDGLAAGRSTISNSAILNLSVNGLSPGGTVELPAPGDVTVTVDARGRMDFGTLELIRNGEVVGSITARRDGSTHTARLTGKVRVDEPCWLAARITTDRLNEFGKPMFAHTSAVYVNVAGKSVFVRASADKLIKLIDEGRRSVVENAKFSTDAQRQAVLKVYDDARARLQSR